MFEELRGRGYDAVRHCVKRRSQSAGNRHLQWA
jgi:hypothetical protein